MRIVLRPLRFGENFYAAQPLGDIERMTEKVAMLYNQRFEIEYKSKTLKSKVFMKKIKIGKKLFSMIFPKFLIF